MQNRQIAETRIRGMYFSPDGETLFVSTIDGNMRAFQGYLLEETPPLPPCRLLAYAPNGQHRVRASGSSIIIEDLLDPLTKERPITFGGTVNGLAFVGREQLIIALGDPAIETHYAASLWSLHLLAGKPVRLPVECRYGVRAIVSYPDTRKIMWVTDNKWLYVQDITRAPSPPSVLKKEARAIALSTNGRFLAVTSDWDVLLYDVERWPSPPRIVGRHTGVVTTLAFSPDGRTLFSGSWDGTVRAWDLEGNRPPVVYQWPVGKVSSIVVSPDGLRAIVGGETGLISIWDLEE